MTNKYYVYAHFTKDSNECFYIGYGTRYRYRDTIGRNSTWKQIVKKHGYDAYIIMEGFKNKYDAIEFEKHLQLLNKPRACQVYGDGIDNRKETTEKVEYKPVINCRGEIFKSLDEAMYTYKINYRIKLRRCCRGETKHCGKYTDGKRIKWQYYLLDNKI